MKSDTAALVVIGTAAALGLWWISRKGIGGTAQAIGTGAVQAVDGLVSGAVYGIGDMAGIPNTSKPDVQAQGRAELASGDYWNASFHLPAGEFLSGIWNRTFTGVTP